MTSREALLSRIVAAFPDRGVPAPETLVFLDEVAEEHSKPEDVSCWLGYWVVAHRKHYTDLIERLDR